MWISCGSSSSCRTPWPIFLGQLECWQRQQHAAQTLSLVAAPWREHLQVRSEHLLSQRSLPHLSALAPLGHLCEMAVLAASHA